jgi:hypothetical protein
MIKSSFLDNSLTRFVALFLDDEFEFDLLSVLYFQ